MNRKELTDYLDHYLHIAEISDYGPQGLQVEAEGNTVNRIALSVDAAPPVIAAAAAWSADMLLVHHGVLWRSVERIAGPLGVRVRGLIANDIHLYAAHLALDAHPEVGNNAVLGKMLGVEVTDWWCQAQGTPIGVFGKLVMPLNELVTEVEQRLNTEVRLLAHGPAQVSQIAIVSGFGADRVAEAQALGADTLLTGETSHANYWAAADHSLNVLFAGHYATETVGVQALGHHLADKFDLDVNFFDFPTDM